jgi:broad specificity phosphatase PhoE
MRLKNKYFILRHGQTIYQTKKKDLMYPAYPEKPPVKLTRKGEKQIKTAAKKLKKIGIDLIFSSDFFRTRQTAKIVAKELNINKISLDKRLRDINFGIYYGQTKEEFYRCFPRYSKKRFCKKPLGGETWLDCQKRMVDFLKKVDKKHKNKNILIVSHGDPLWLLEGAVKNLSLTKLLKIRRSEVGRIKVGELRKLRGRVS